MSRLFLGIEGGASKTDGVLIDDSGKVYAALQAGPSNPWVRRIISIND
jgi:N-acetylglucosamine kinase-like BadF-type ATPase